MVDATQKRRASYAPDALINNGIVSYSLFASSEPAVPPAKPCRISSPVK